MSEYTFKRLDENLISKLPPLYKDAFGIELSISRIKNKFNSYEYTGKKNIAYVAFDSSGEAVALQGVFPVLVYYKGKEYLCAQLGDGMTHTLHRRKGLFIKVTELVCELAKQEGIKILFVFTYGQIASYNGLVNHIGFLPQKNIKSYVIPIMTLPFCRLLNKSKFGSYMYNIYMKLIVFMFYKSANCFNPKTSINDNKVLKNIQFFNYKFSISNSFIIKLNNVLSWVKYTKFGSLSVGDFEHYKYLHKTISQLKRFCFFTGIRAIQIETSPDSDLDVFLQNKYSFKENYNICQIILDNSIPLNKINFTFGDFDNF